MKLSRRTFTRLGALSGLGTIALPACTGSDPANRHASGDLASGGVLTAEERLVFERFAEVYIPTADTPLKPLSEVGYVEHIDRVVAALDKPTIDDIHAALKLFNLGPFVIGLHLRPFTKLGPNDRLAAIGKWESGFETQRGIVVMIKRLVGVGYLQDVEAARRLGFQGPVSDDAGIVALGNAPMPLEAAPAGDSG